MGMTGNGGAQQPFGPAMGGGTPRGQQKTQPPATPQQPGQIQGGTGSVPAGAVPPGAAPGVTQPNQAGGGNTAPTADLNTLMAQWRSGGGGQMAPQFYNELARALGAPPAAAPSPAAGGATPPPQVGTGGTPLPVEYQTPIGPVERYLQQQLIATGTSNPYIDRLAMGEVPAATLAQFRNEQARMGANLAEQFGGARFGSDYAGAYGRQSNQALTALMAQSEQNALAARQAQMMGLQTQYGLGGGLLGSETGRANDALGRLLQEYGGSTGLPPQISALLGLLGIGGGQTVGKGTAGKFL